MKSESEESALYASFWNSICVAGGVIVLGVLVGVVLGMLVGVLLGVVVGVHASPNE